MSFNPDKKPVEKSSDKTYTLFDNFDGQLNSNFWDFKRANPELISFGEWDGKTGVEIKVDPPENPYLVKTLRNELGEYYSNSSELNKKISTSFDFLVPTDLENSNKRLVISQWKALHSSESPPFAWRYQNGCLFFTVETPTGRLESKYVEIIKGKWYKLEIQFKTTRNHSGFVNVYLNNNFLFSYFGKIGQSNDDPRVIFKFGPYTDNIENETRLVYSNFEKKIIQE